MTNHETKHKTVIPLFQSQSRIQSLGGIQWRSVSVSKKSCVKAAQSFGTTYNF